MLEIQETLPIKGMRKAMVKRMDQSATVPLHYQGMYIDVTELLSFRKKFNAENNVKCSLNDFIVKAVGLSLKKAPMMNAALHYDENGNKDSILVYESCNVSVMTASKKGLMAPVIKDADKKSVIEISEEMKGMVERADAGKLTLDDVSEGTFGLTNIGKLNSFDSVPRPFPPQGSIMTACTAKKMPVVITDENGEDKIVVRTMMKIVTGSDHRITDGVPLAVFMNSMKDLLENPNSLID